MFVLCISDMTHGIKGIDLNIRVCLPPEKTLIKSVRQRRSRNNRTKEPANLSELKTDSIMTSRDGKFCLFDSQDENRIVIFATRKVTRMKPRSH